MSFDLLAPHYRWMEAILAGEKLQRCRIAFLKCVRDCQRVLICGEGNGRFLCECRRELSQAWITCVEASAGMLAQASARLQRHRLPEHRIEFVHADARDWEFTPGTYDLIVTHFFLDCFDRTDLASVVRRLGRAAAPSCAWLISDFQIPEYGFARARALVIHKLMYWFFRWATGISGDRVNSPQLLLEEQGFNRANALVAEWGLLRSELWLRTSSSSR